MDKNNKNITEIELKAKNGMAVLCINIVLSVATLCGIILGAFLLDGGKIELGVVLLVLGCVYWCIIMPLLFAGLKVIKPNEALVLTLFGRYIGTLKGEGIYFVNPFCVAVTPPKKEKAQQGAASGDVSLAKLNVSINKELAMSSRKLSLKAMTLNNDKQKINDKMGNPIIIGIVVIWKVADTAKAMFNVDDYMEFLSIQSDSALRNIVRLYPYDAADNDVATEKSLRGSSGEIAGKIRDEIQEKVDIAGLTVIEARITHLSYAPEIAAAMLQRQQASAVVDARQLIVEGAVGMVEMALDKLKTQGVIELDEERKAAMVSNLLVVLCGNRDAQPIVNSGSIY